ncbi:MAG: InlB B-repeat-containing protein [Lachnospiraceae bacterium]|nr:InlB B-repeat-containing protein [Lachnospiraceae bacterium]
MLRHNSDSKIKRIWVTLLICIVLSGGLSDPIFSVRALGSVSQNSPEQEMDPGSSEEKSEFDSVSFDIAGEGEEIGAQEFVQSETEPELSGEEETYREEPVEDTQEDAFPAEELAQSQEGAQEVTDPILYTLTFDYNGGIDKDGNSFCQVQVPKGELLGAYIKQVQEKEVISPYVFAGKWEEYEMDPESGELSPTDKTRTVNSTKKVTKDYTYKAMWSESYARFAIRYELNGGRFREGSGEYLPSDYTYWDKVVLPEHVEKKGYCFDGFYKDASFITGVLTAVLPNTSIGDIRLYAKWKSAVPTKTPVINSVTNPSTGNVKITFKKMKNITGHEIEMSTDRSFKQNRNTLLLDAVAKSVKLTNMPKGNTYYFRMRSYNLDSTGEKAYSAYSNVLKIKVKKGVQEYEAKKDSAVLNVCSVQKNKLTVSYTVSKRVKSSDDSYYLVALNPYTGKYLKVIEQTIKQKKVKFALSLRDEWGNDLTQTQFALAVKRDDKYSLISGGTFISNPEAAAGFTAAFPKTRTKKGLQMPQNESLISDLGLNHTFFNMDLNQVLEGSNKKVYRYNGKTYYFNDAWSPTISALNAQGVTVTGQIMLTYDESTKYMIPKSGSTPGKTYYAINTKDKKARETFEAAMSFLAETYSQKNCHLDNWVLGNEVNMHQDWYYAGDISRKTFMKNYANTYRILYYAVRSHSKNARVYICTDHTWSDTGKKWGTRTFMDAFDKEIKAQQENIQWNLAFHAYPAVLTSAATWKDTLATDNVNTTYVSPKNLDVLTKYVKKNYGKKTRIILSEQGFTSKSGSDVQAAAIVYTYYKAEFDTMIDAVIFRSDIDNSVESAQGLYLGLMDIYGNKKPAYDVMKYMDTKNASKYTKPYLKTIGISKWKKIAPGYDANRFK